MRVGSISYAYASQLGAIAAASSAAPVAAESSTLPSSTSVSISSEAQSRYAAEAEASESKYKVDASFLKKDFPEDIWAEARSRLAERRQVPGIPGGMLPGEVGTLPLLPESEALLAQFKAEMRSLDNSDPVQNRRFNQLLNMSVTLQRTGWMKPMTEEDVVREWDISMATGLLLSQEPQSREDSPADLPTELPDPMAAWKRRWEEDGRTMPEVEATIGRSFWLDLAAKAGIGEEEFLQSARELAKSFRGEQLTQRIEGLISDRYAAQL